MNPFRCVLALCALASASGCSASDDSDVGINRASDNDAEASDAPTPRAQASTPSAGAPLCDAPLLPGYGYTRTASAWPGGTDEWRLAVEGPGYLALLDAPSDGGNYRYTDYRYTRSGWIGASEGGFIEDERGLRLLGYPAGNPEASCLAALRAPSTSPPRPTTKAVLAGNMDASADLFTEPFDIEDPGSTAHYNIVVWVLMPSGQRRAVDIFLRNEGGGLVQYFVMMTGPSLGESEWGQTSQGQLWFDIDGALDRVESPPLCLDGSEPEQCITLDFGDPKSDGGTGLRGFTYTDDAFQLRSQTIDGTPAGTALFVSVDEDGVVSVEYDNDEVLPIGNLVIARFAKESELRELERGVFVETKESGPPTFFSAQASLEAEPAGPQ